MVHRQNDNFPELLHGNSQLYSDLDNIHSNLESNIIRLIFVKKMGTHTLGVVNIKKFYFNHRFLFSTVLEILSSISSPHNWSLWQMMILDGQDYSWAMDKAEELASA